MAKKKHILTKKTPGKKRKLSQTPAAIAKRSYRSRKPGSKNKPKAVPFVEASFSILSIIPPKEKLKRILDIMDNLQKEELTLLQTYPEMSDSEKLKTLDRLSNIVKELGIMTLYKEMLISDNKPQKKSDA